MELNEYQAKARATAIYPKELTILYPVLGLNGEAGEVAEKTKKLFRDNEGILTDEIRETIKKELGDVMWYLANTASDFELTLNEIAETNVAKLASRASRGVLKGSGDNR